jgi:hypothetical protein
MGERREDSLGREYSFGRIQRVMRRYLVTGGLDVECGSARRPSFIYLCQLR